MTTADITASPIEAEPDATPPAPQPAAAQAAPTAENERFASLDILRGFALFGIFLMNIESFNRPLRSLFSDPLGTSVGIDRVASWLIYVFVVARFWTLFSLLFGAGFALLLSRAETRGHGFLATYLRRTIVLGLIGLAHGVLIWSGDILVTYSLAALLLVLALFGNRWQRIVVLLAIAGATALHGNLGGYFIPLVLSLLTTAYLRTERTFRLLGRSVPLASAIVAGMGVFAVGAGVVGLFMNKGEPAMAICSGVALWIMAALLTRFAEPRSQRPLVLGLSWYCTPFVAMVVAFSIMLMVGRPALDPKEAETQQKEFVEGQEKGAKRTAVEIRVLTSESYVEVVKFRSGQFMRTLANDGPSLGTFLSMFLIGLWFVRSGTLLQPEAHKSTLKRFFWIGLAIGLPLSIGATIWLPMATSHTMDDDGYALESMIHLLSGLPLTLAYASGLLLALCTAFGKRALSWLAPVGRMALTNYLMQSVVSATFFYHYGLGHYGWTRIPQVGFVVVVFALQVALSHWWLRHFRFGPMEWVWRSLTYLKPQPWRARSGAATATAFGQPG
ncbi:hypothetical protein BH09PSE6_BH09PSE6_32920 [soil metagenome]